MSELGFVFFILVFKGYKWLDNSKKNLGWLWTEYKPKKNKK